MVYGSICSGVEAASLAWEPLGWQPQWFAEIEKFPAAVLTHHWPKVENLGDITDETFIERAGAIDLLVGGTPCQSFSVAGLRGGLDDDRGNLALRFCQIALHLAPRWIVWENVPGVLSSNGGKDFGSILGALGECGYGVAYRILDAQYFGVAQRRRRVFVVGYLGDWRPPAAVLFERESLLGHTEKSAKKRQKAAGDVGGGLNENGPTHALTQRYDSSEDGTGRGVPLVAPTVTGGPPFSRTGNERVEADAIVVEVAAPLGSRQRYDLDHETYIPEMVNAREDPIYVSGKSLPLGAKDTGHAVAFLPGQGVAAGTLGIATEQAPTLRSGCDNYGVVKPPQAVRRLTPVECERLQGMPDNHTRIPWRNKPAEDCPDGNRYKAIGNSMAVPVMRWIGERIELVEKTIGAAGSATEQLGSGGNATL